jgi:hypothetical protein
MLFTSGKAEAAAYIGRYTSNKVEAARSTSEA